MGNHQNYQQEVKTMVSQATNQTSGHLARPKRAAEHFQVTTQTLWRWSKQEGFPQPLKYAQTVLYDIAAIEQWMREQEGV